jgi:thiol-disulfide isomerase/thioredoxin
MNSQTKAANPRVNHDLSSFPPLLSSAPQPQRRASAPPRVELDNQERARLFPRARTASLACPSEPLFSNSPRLQIEPRPLPASMALTDVATAADFDKLLASNEFVACHYWASWCEPCAAMDQLMREMVGKDNVARLRINTHAEPPFRQLNDTQGGTINTQTRCSQVLPPAILHNATQEKGGGRGHLDVANSTFQALLNGGGTAQREVRAR